MNTINMDSSCDDLNNLVVIDDTEYLLSIPGMRESIIEGMNTPLDECSEELEWYDDTK